MKKMLPIATPFITCMPMDAHIQSIVLTEPALYPWLMSQFIQLWGCSPKMEDFFIYFLNTSYWFSCPYLVTQEISKEIVCPTAQRAIEFVINALEHDYYVVFPIDRYCIPSYEATLHLPHEMLIYGYDTNRQKLYAADFTGRERSIYSHFECSFNDFQNSYNTSTNSFDWHQIIRLAKIDKEGLHPEFSIAAMRSFDFTIITQLLKDYSNSVNSQLRFHMQHVKGDPYSCRVGGLAVYDVLRNYILDICKDPHENSLIDIRPFYVLYSHKIMALHRIYYIDKLIDHSIPLSIINSFTSLKNEAYRLQLRMMKANSQRNFKMIPHIYDKYANNIVSEEKDSINQLVDILEANNCKNPTLINKAFDPTREYKIPLNL